MELEHGWHRAASAVSADRRRRYLDDVGILIPAEPVSREIALIAAEIDARARATGKVIATADLLIGATAACLGFSVVTVNLRHFQMIPGLEVLGF